MLIEIKKIKDKEVKGVANPLGTGALKEEKMMDEAIDIESIKSMRPFHRNGGKHSDIEGDITVIYLWNDKNDKSKGHVEIHVSGNWRQIKEEVNELKSRCGS